MYIAQLTDGREILNASFFGDNFDVCSADIEIGWLRYMSFRKKLRSQTYRGFFALSFC